MREIITKKYVTEDGKMFDNQASALEWEGSQWRRDYIEKIDTITEFTVTEQHIKLLEQLIFDWDDSMYSGYVVVDCKRPYGNSDIYGDIAETIGVQASEDEEYTDEQYEIMDKLHIDMLACLQILSKNLSIAPGKYIRERYTQRWRAANSV